MATANRIKDIATTALTGAYIELLPAFARVPGRDAITTWTNTTDLVDRVRAGEATGLAVMSAGAVDELNAAGMSIRGSLTPPPH